MTRNLFLGPYDTCFLEVINQELVAPSTAAARLGVGSPGGFPVVMEACKNMLDLVQRGVKNESTLNKDAFDRLWPDFGAATVFQELAVLSLGGNALGVLLGGRGRGGGHVGEKREGGGDRNELCLYRKVKSFRNYLVGSEMGISKE